MLVTAPRVYLAGAIQGCTNSEAKDWRADAASLLSWAEVVDPMTRDYRGAEIGNHREIVEADLEAIRSCAAVLAMCERPSWGTAMEIRAAHSMGIMVVAVASAAVPSPWLVYHSVIQPTLAQACAYLRAVL